MTPIKVYLDEDVHHLIADALRDRGHEALTTVDAGRQGSTDPEQLRFAADNGYAILSYNIADFPRLHSESIGGSDHHYGIIVATQHSPAANARAILLLVRTFAAEDLIDQLVYLNNWM